MNDKARRERFEALWREHQGIVLKVASIYAHGAEDRRDLAQEIGIQLWRSLHRYDERRTKFSTWLYRVALNTAISQSRHKRHRTDALCEPLQPFHLDTIGGDEADGDRIAILYAAIDGLDAFPIILMLIQHDWDRQGYDYWNHLPGLVPWLALNGLIALVLALLVYWLMKKAGRARWLENNFAGSAIRRAQADLDEIIRFERE